MSRFERYTVQSFISWETGRPAYRLYDELHDAPCLTHFATIGEAQRVANDNNRTYSLRVG